MKIKKIVTTMGISFCLFCMNGCATQSPALTTVPQGPLMRYQKGEWSERQVSTVPKTRAQFLSNQSPEIRKAFLRYQHTGKAPIVESQAFQEFPFGEYQPIVVCEPLKVCDIELQEGELVTGIRTGDSIRWKYDLVYSGENSTRQAHVVFRPKFSDLSTNVIITTTRRTYYLGLLSKEGTYVKQVKFYYPDDIQKSLDEMNHKIAEERLEGERIDIASVPNIDPTKLDDHYSIRSSSFFTSPSWKPIRAFNDGTHVYIQMPAQIRVTDAPVFFVRDIAGNQKLVNYRMKDNFYIVDVLFREAYMLTGTGRAQEKVYITYKG